MRHVHCGVVAPLLLLGLSSCMHVKGVVLEDPSQRPMTTARFTVGRPDGIGVFAQYDVDHQGKFDFYISPTDDNALYVFDNSLTPSMTMRRIDRTEISDNMKIHIRKPIGDVPTGVQNFGIGP